MTQPLVLHYAPDNASLCVRLLLEAMDMAYETALVDRRAQGHKTPAYIALNPNGLIPTLVTPAGAMFETGAILLWLADQKPGVVFPATDEAARAKALTWLFWLSNTLHPCLRQIFYPNQYSPDPKGLRDMAQAKAAQLLDIAELENWPKLHRLTQTFEATPAAQRAALAEGLGAHPFSQPVHPNPPEGSAT